MSLNLTSPYSKKKIDNSSSFDFHSFELGFQVWYSNFRNINWCSFGIILLGNCIGIFYRFTPGIVLYRAAGKKLDSKSHLIAWLTFRRYLIPIAIIYSCTTENGHFRGKLSQSERRIGWTSMYTFSIFFHIVSYYDLSSDPSVPFLKADWFIGAMLI